MKIHKIILKDYQQFKDLEIDLTYPVGHEKAGQPLDKICFIGQSGTGKTTLLRLVKCCVTGNPWVNYRLRMEAQDEQRADILYGDSKIQGARSIGKKGIVFGSASREFELEFQNSSQPYLIFFPCEQSQQMPGENEIKAIDNWKEIEDSGFSGRKMESYLNDLRTGKFLDMNFQLFDKVAEAAFKQLESYQAREVVQANALKEIVLKTESSELVEKARKSYKDWALVNPNPIHAIADACDPILEPFGVRIKRTIDEETLKALGTLHLETLSAIHLAPNIWSTGIKHIFESATTLATIRPNGSLLLIDEPEKSLYPDVQSKIIDFYTSLTTDCQFFYATHSPIIASSFDPWEIVELKFDVDNQYVIQETNYEGERHVDNYTVYPKYQRWDRILMNLFDLKEEGNGKVRQEEMLNAVMLKHEIEALVAAKKNKGKAFKDKVDQFELLSKKLDFYAEP